MTLFIINDLSLAQKSIDSPMHIKIAQLTAAINYDRNKKQKKLTTTTTKIVIYNERQYKAPVLLASIEMMVMTIGSKQ
ncbi:MAG: hypothetical protein GKR90_28080 [Pseudomonadales bacterium]|nr:hypothetical protein [Pseudomonadales bacterium]